MCDSTSQQSLNKSNEYVGMTKIQNEPFNTYHSSETQASSSEQRQVPLDNIANDTSFASVSTEDYSKYNEHNNFNENERRSIQANYEDGLKQNPSQGCEKSSKSEFQEYSGNKVEYDHNQSTEISVGKHFSESIPICNENFMQNSEYNKFLNSQSVQSVHLSSQDISEVQFGNTGENNECMYERNSGWQFENRNSNSDMNSIVKCDSSISDYSQIENVSMYSNNNVELRAQPVCNSDTEPSLMNDTSCTNYNESQNVYTNLVPLRYDVECGGGDDVQDSSENSNINRTEYNHDNSISDKLLCSESPTNIASNKQFSYNNVNSLQYLHVDENQIHENDFGNNSGAHNSKILSDNHTHLQNNSESETNSGVFNNESFQPSQTNYVDTNCKTANDNLNVQLSSEKLHTTESFLNDNVQQNNVITAQKHDIAQAFTVSSNSISTEEMNVTINEKNHEPNLQENGCNEGSEQCYQKFSETQNSDQFNTRQANIQPALTNVDNVTPHFDCAQIQNPHLQVQNMPHGMMQVQLHIQPNTTVLNEKSSQLQIQNTEISKNEVQQLVSEQSNDIQVLSENSGSEKQTDLSLQGDESKIQQSDQKQVASQSQCEPPQVVQLQQMLLQPSHNIQHTQVIPQLQFRTCDIQQLRIMATSNFPEQLHQSDVQRLLFAASDFQNIQIVSAHMVPQVQVQQLNVHQGPLQQVQLIHKNVNEIRVEDTTSVSNGQQSTPAQTQTTSMPNDSESSSSNLSTDEDVSTNIKGSYTWEVVEPLQPHIKAQVTNSTQKKLNGTKGVFIILKGEVIPLKEWSILSADDEIQVVQPTENMTDDGDSNEVEYVISSSDDMSDDEALDSTDTKLDVAQISRALLDKQSANFDTGFVSDQWHYGKPIIGMDETMHNCLRERIDEYLEDNIKDIIKFGKRVIGLIVWQEKSLKVQDVPRLIKKLDVAKANTDVILLPVFKAEKENLCDHWLQHPTNTPEEVSAHNSHFLCYDVWYNDNPYIMSSFCIPHMINYSAAIQKRLSDCRKVLKAAQTTDTASKNGKVMVVKYGQLPEKNSSSTNNSQNEWSSPVVYSQRHIESLSRTAPPVEILELSSDEEAEAEFSNSDATVNTVEPYNDDKPDADDSGDEDFFLNEDGSWADTYVIPHHSLNMGADHYLTDFTVMINETGITLWSPMNNRGCRIKARIRKDDVTKIFICLSQKFPMITIDLKDSSGTEVRERFKLEEPKTEFEVMLKCRVTIVPTQFMKGCRDLMKNMFPPPIRTGITVKTAESMLNYINSKGSFLADVPSDLLNDLHSLGDGSFSAASKLQNQRIVYNEVVGNKVVLTYPPPPEKGGITVTVSDLMCLNDGELLNDVMIDFYLKYLWKNVMKPEDADRTYIFSNFFYLKLTTKPGKENLNNSPYEVDETLLKSEIRYQRIRSWLRKVNLFDKDFIVIPIVQAMHWFVAVICYPRMILKTVPQVVSDSASDSGNGADCFSQNSNSQSSLPKGSARSKVQIKIPDGWPATPTCDEADPDIEIESENPFWSDYKEDDDGNGIFSDLSEELEENGGIIKRPRILIFDSVNTVDGRTKIFATLRDLLLEEYKAKVDKNVIFPKHLIKSVLVDVPKQRNNTDCGLYLMHFVERFFDDPFKDYRLPLASRSDWFSDKVISLKRGVVFDVVEKLIKESGTDILSLCIPPMKFKKEKSSTSSRGKGRRRPALAKDQVPSIPTCDAESLISNQAISIFVTDNGNSSSQVSMEHIEDSYGSSYSDGGTYYEMMQTDSNVSEDGVDVHHRFELNANSFECTDSQSEEDSSYMANTSVTYVSSEESIAVASDCDTVLQVPNNRRISLKRERDEIPPTKMTKQSRVSAD